MSDLINWVKERPHVLSLEEVGGRLHHVCGMAEQHAFVSCSVFFRDGCFLDETATLSYDRCSHFDSSPRSKSTSSAGQTPLYSTFLEPQTWSKRPMIDDSDDDDDVVAKPGEDGHAKPDQGPVLRQPLQGDDVELPGRAVRQQGADLCNGN